MICRPGTWRLSVRRGNTKVRAGRNHLPLSHPDCRWLLILIVALHTGKLHSGNLYQLLAYLRNRQATRPAGPKHEGILLYPQVGGPLRADIRLEGFRIQARTVDLNRDWRAIHGEMLATIGVDGLNSA